MLKPQIVECPRVPAGVQVGSLERSLIIFADGRCTWKQSNAPILGVAVTLRQERSFVPTPVGMLPPKQVFALVNMLGVSHLVHEDKEQGTTHPKAINSFLLVWNEAGIVKASF